MGSRNGTFVNGEKLSGPCTARSGDTLRVGRLQFEVVIDHAQPGAKKPPVAGVADAARRTADSTQHGFDEDSITDWLSVSAQEEPGKVLQDTTHFSLEETPTKMFTRSDELSESSSDTPTAPDDISESDSKTRKKRFNKLPPRKAARAESSRNAADDVLRKFFNRR
jgi:predicted component of type VI protein secretion system